MILDHFFYEVKSPQQWINTSFEEDWESEKGFPIFNANIMKKSLEWIIYGIPMVKRFYCKGFYAIIYIVGRSKGYWFIYSGSIIKDGWGFGEAI